MRGKVQRYSGVIPHYRIQFPDLDELIKPATTVANILYVRYSVSTVPVPLFVAGLLRPKRLLCVRKTLGIKGHPPDYGAVRIQVTKDTRA